MWELFLFSVFNKMYRIYFFIININQKPLHALGELWRRPYGIFVAGFGLWYWLKKWLKWLKNLAVPFAQSQISMHLDDP